MHGVRGLRNQLPVKRHCGHPGCGLRICHNQHLVKGKKGFILQ
jgi:hypothetical protein